MPLTADLKDTLYFGSVSEQQSYFMARTALLLTDQSYVRKERGIIKAQVSADRIYDCSYLMYRNTSYGNKWFYAFITGIEYDNDLTSIISFQIDDIQTWFFEYDTPPCLVERCHSYSDSIGDNIVPEPVDPGDMVPNDQIALHESNMFAPILNKPVLAVSFIDPEGSSVTGHLIDNCFTTGNIYVFDLSTDAGVAAATEWLEEISEQYFESIVGMWMIPMWAVGAVDPNSPLLPLNIRTGKSYVHSLNSVHPGTQLAGYVPKNNKLYTYPYNLLEVNTAAGGNIALKYEFFKNGSPQFREYWNLPDPVSSSLRPVNYRNVADPAMDLCVTLTSYPMAMWSGDAYKAWLAQNKVSIGETILKIMGTVAATVVGGPAAGLATAAYMGLGLADSAYKASIAADKRGGGSSGSNAWSNNMMDYYASRMSVNRQKAEEIDSFFTAFGYAQNRVMRPPRHNRRSFTYVKTDGCTVNGPLPSEAAAKIKASYDSGIRFWANHTSFGNMAIDNYTL